MLDALLYILYSILCMLHITYYIYAIDVIVDFLNLPWFVLKNLIFKKFDFRGIFDFRVGNLVEFGIWDVDVNFEMSVICIFGSWVTLVKGWDYARSIWLWLSRLGCAGWKC